MIRTSSVPNIYKILSFVFYYGLSKQFRYEYIEERISKSHFVHELENDFNESSEMVGGNNSTQIKIISRFMLASHKIFGWQILIMALVGDAV